MSCLFCIHVTAALAVTPQQKRMHKHPLVRSKKKAVASPKKASSQFVDKASPDAPVQLPTPITTAQDDTTKERRYVAEEMLMQQAWMYSAILPGWGQVCNEHYWKVPVIYVGFAGLFWGAVYYHREYLESKRELIHTKGTYSLEHYVDEYRTSRDLFIIFAALWYVANIFDAYVGSSLKTFTLSDDISMEVQPTILTTTRNLSAIGLSLTLSFQNENTPDRLWKDGAGY